MHIHQMLEAKAGHGCIKIKTRNESFTMQNRRRYPINQVKYIKTTSNHKYFETYM